MSHCSGFRIPGSEIRVVSSAASPIASTMRNATAARSFAGASLTCGFASSARAALQRESPAPAAVTSGRGNTRRRSATRPLARQPKPRRDGHECLAALELEQDAVGRLVAGPRELHPDGARVGEMHVGICRIGQLDRAGEGQVFRSRRRIQVPRPGPLRRPPRSRRRADAKSLKAIRAAHRLLMTGNARPTRSTTCRTTEPSDLAAIGVVRTAAKAATAGNTRWIAPDILATLFLGADPKMYDGFVNRYLKNRMVDRTLVRVGRCRRSYQKWPCKRAAPPSPGGRPGQERCRPEH